MATHGQAFDRLINIIHKQQQLINSIANKLEEIQSMGGGGSASIEDYVPEKKYKRNVLLVDTNTETVYRVIDEYVSVDIETDHSEGHLKLVGYESQIVSFNHPPTQAEIDALPEDVLVAIHSTTDDPYTPVLSSDG